MVVRDRIFEMVREMSVLIKGSRYAWAECEWGYPEPQSTSSVEEKGTQELCGGSELGDSDE